MLASAVLLAGNAQAALLPLQGSAEELDQTVLTIPSSEAEQMQAGRWQGCWQRQHRLSDEGFRTRCPACA